MPIIMSINNYKRGQKITVLMETVKHCLIGLFRQNKTHHAASLQIKFWAGC